MKYVGDIAQNLTDELLEVIHRYDETLVVSTVLGCLEIIKAQLIADHTEDEDDDD